MVDLRQIWLQCSLDDPDSNIHSNRFPVNCVRDLNVMLFAGKLVHNACLPQGSPELNDAHSER